MPSGRNEYRYDQVDPKLLLSFAADPTSIPYEDPQQYGTQHRNKPVKINPTTKLVSLAADGDEILGMLEQRFKNADNGVRVQVAGVIVFSCASGATFTAGQRVVANGAGGVKAASSAAGCGRVLFKPDATHVVVVL